MLAAHLTALSREQASTVADPTHHIGQGEA